MKESDMDILRNCFCRGLKIANEHLAILRNLKKGQKLFTEYGTEITEEKAIQVKRYNQDRLKQLIKVKLGMVDFKTMF